MPLSRGTHERDSNHLSLFVIRNAHQECLKREIHESISAPEVLCTVVYELQGRTRSGIALLEEPGTIIR